ncbi:MAG TPA: M20/M25/M40 family metallo-hydrolase [Geminicoccaceae bacterium]|nr:M20/M25/M40 family metallo-hydrolase [Geminicoccaceae bacterium]
MQDTPADIKAFLVAERPRQTAFLAELVKVPSDNPPGDCRRHAERAAALLEPLGLAVERHPVPDELARAQGMASVANLVVRHRFGDGRVVALNAHGDAVPPGRGWQRDPYGGEIDGGCMYGRGVAVSKSDFATYTWALLALRTAGLPLGGTVELHFTYDESAGGELGPRWLLEQGIVRPDLAIGAGFAYSVVTAHNGCLHLEVEVRGRAAHAARPTSGADALEAATGILTELYAHRRGYVGRLSKTPGIGAPQLNVGLIAGGINTNVVPDRITFRLDRRMIPEEGPEAVEAELRELIERTASRYKRIETEVRRIMLAVPLTPLPGSAGLADLICRHASLVTGDLVEPEGVPLYTDARHYAAAGVPTVLYGAGPRTLEEANANGPDERLVLDDLYKATEVVTRALLDLLAPPAQDASSR